MAVVKTIGLSLTKIPFHVLITRRYSSAAPGLLSDINVLDFTRVIAGPYCTMTLGDLGANIIKVESLDGDEARKWGPPFIKGSSESYYFLSVNRNKKSICIDVKTQEGKNVLYDLAKKCDVMVENFIPGKLDAMDVGYEKLSKINTKLIYCAITGFGPTGPHSKKPGYDVIAAAMGGLLNNTGDRDGDPVKPAVPLTDLCTGLHAFGAIMTALYHRQKTGRGQKIDCNLLSTQINVMINVASTYLNCNIEGQKWGTAHASIVPYQAFKTKDGFMVLGTGSNAQFADLCRLIGREELVHDERFKTNSDRVKNREEIIKIIGDVIKRKTKKEWTDVFKDATFPNGPVNTMKEVFEDEHVKEMGLVQELPHPLAGSVKVVGPPTVYSEGGNQVRCAPPTLGQHTRDVLSNFLGYHEEKIEHLFDHNIEAGAARAATEPMSVITLRPTRKQTRKKVVWTEDTVDNEHMNKKKSKCCCIYEKPHKFGESDSEDSDDECEHCFGHVERRRDRQQEGTGTTIASTAAASSSDQPDGASAVVPEQPVTVTLPPRPDTSPPRRPDDASS